MAKTKIKWNIEGFRQLRTTPAVRNDLLQRARSISDAAGGEAMGYKVTPLLLEDPRGAASVMATGKAAYDNRKYNSLMRSIDAGRR